MLQLVFSDEIEKSINFWSKLLHGWVQEPHWRRPVVSDFIFILKYWLFIWITMIQSGDPSIVPDCDSDSYCYSSTSMMSYKKISYKICKYASSNYLNFEILLRTFDWIPVCHLWLQGLRSQSTCWGVTRLQLNTALNILAVMENV